MAIAAALLLAPAAARAGDPPPLTLGEDAGALLLPHCAVLEDPGRALGLADVIARAQDLRPVSGDSLRVGFTSSAYWLRCSVVAPSPGSWFIEEALQPDLVDLMAPGAPPRRGGRKMPFGAFDTVHASVYLPLDLDAPGRADLYLRYESGAPLVLRPQVWAPRPMMRQVAGDSRLGGLYYGLLLVMLAYNLALWVSLRQRVYADYALYLASLTLVVATIDRLTIAYLWPGSAWIETSFMGTALVYVFALAGFTRTYLSTPRDAPRVDRVLRAGMVGAAALFVTTFFSRAQIFKEAGHVLSPLVIGATAAAGVAARRSGNRSAGYFLVAMGTLLVTAMLRMQTQLGNLPPGLLTLQGWRFGSAAEVTLLSLGLAARVRAIRHDKERALAEALAARQALTVSLERQVQERTAELQGALDRLKEAQTRLVQEERMASLGQLVAALIHEVGNPLNFTIGGAVEIERRLGALSGALDRAPADTPGHDAAREAVRAVRRALDLVTRGNGRIKGIVDNLRTYARAGSRDREATDLAEGIRSTLALIRPRLDAQGIAVDLDLELLPPVSSRPGELNQVFMNLLLNSCDALPDGGAIRVRARSDGDRVELRFADDGPGVPAEVRAQIFDPFFTTRASGTGLGLSISRQIVAQHGGDLTLVEHSRGAELVIRLPVSSIDEGASPLRTRAAPGS